MKFWVRFEPEAEAEIIEAFNWYEEQSFGLGGKFLRAVKQAEAALIDARKDFASIVFADPVCNGQYPVAAPVRSILRIV